MPTWNMMALQDPTTNNMMFMSTVHDIVMQVMTAIIVLISYMMLQTMANKYTNRTMTDNNTMEVMWTVIPMVILTKMATPSLQLLYLLEDMHNPNLSIKVMGHQWYWTYEYSDFLKSYDSYMMNSPYNNFRLLDVDNRMVCPQMSFMRVLCSSSDVIHSWTIPSMGVKTDAIPGRMNQILVNPMTIGLFYGQCSEICGMNHSFMPIVMEVVPTPQFIVWLKT